MKIKNCILFIFCIVFLVNTAFASDTVQEQRQNLVNECKNLIGTPYVYGGNSESGIDCSGLVVLAAKRALGITLPRTAQDIYYYSKKISRDELQKGDFVFFNTSGYRTYSSEVTHIGVYIGKNQFIHAVSDGPNTGVIVSSLKQDYWIPKFIGAGTIFTENEESSYPVEIPESKSENNYSEDIYRDSFYQGKPKKHNKLPKMSFDFAAFYDWNLYEEHKIGFYSQGLTLQLGWSFDKWWLKPGIDLGFAYVKSTDSYEFPLSLSLGLGDLWTIYGGAVINLGTSDFSQSNSKNVQFNFPGVVGLRFQGLPWKIGNVGFSFVQDISFSSFGKEEIKTMPVWEILGSELIFKTGIKIDIYVK